jgi:hypothetical protein
MVIFQKSSLSTTRSYARFNESLALRPPRRSLAPHWAHEAYPSLMKMSFHCRMVTLSPNHMWVSSWSIRLASKPAFKIDFAS